MKLIRFGEVGNEKPGLLIQNIRYDVSALVRDYDESFFESDGMKSLKKEIETGKTFPVVNENIRWASPIARPSKIICIGLNYIDHAKETGAAIPEEPIVFFKSTTSLCGPYDNLIIPPNSNKTDWEVELAFVMGKKATYVEESNAINYVAGYCLHNDYSEREYQLERGGQWVKGKSCDSFGPLGPWLATKDEIRDVNNLSMWLAVNGKSFQKSNTSNLIFKIPFLVHYLSSFMTLLPGDIISTGTPNGVGLGIKPEPVYIKLGDIIELGIQDLGEQKQSARSYRS